jgi:hypothetical protein
MNRSVATQPQFDSISIEINSALIEQNSFDRTCTLPATGFNHAIRQNHRHLGFGRGHRFIDIGSQLGRSGAAWLLTMFLKCTALLTAEPRNRQSA